MLDFPEWARKLIFVLIGEWPLQANEDMAYDSTTAWSDHARRVRNLRALIVKSIDEAGAALPPGVGDSYVRAMSTLTGAGGRDYLNEFADGLEKIGQGQVKNSRDIMESKWSIIAELIHLMLELALIAALSFFTGGASAGEAALARARSRLAILLALDRLLQRTHLMPSISEAIQEAFETFAVRLAMLTINKGDHRPDGFNWTDIGKSALFGLVVGGLAQGLDKVFHNFKNLFKNFDDNKFNKNLFHVTGDFTTEAVAEGAGETLVNGVLDGKWSWSWNTFVGAGLSGISELAGHHVFEGAGSWLGSNYFKNANLRLDLQNTNTFNQPGGPGSAKFTPTPTPVVPPPYTPPVPITPVESTFSAGDPLTAGYRTPPPEYEPGVPHIPTATNEFTTPDYSTPDFTEPSLTPPPTPTVPTVVTPVPMPSRTSNVTPTSTPTPSPVTEVTPEPTPIVTSSTAPPRSAPVQDNRTPEVTPDPTPIVASGTAPPRSTPVQDNRTPEVTPDPTPVVGPDTTRVSAPTPSRTSDVTPTPEPVLTPGQAPGSTVMPTPSPSRTSNPTSSSGPAEGEAPVPPPVLSPGSGPAVTPTPSRMSNVTPTPSPVTEVTPEPTPVVTSSAAPPRSVPVQDDRTPEVTPTPKPTPTVSPVPGTTVTPGPVRTSAVAPPPASAEGRTPAPAPGNPATPAPGTGSAPARPSTPVTASRDAYGSDSGDDDTASYSGTDSDAASVNSDTTYGSEDLPVSPITPVTSSESYDFPVPDTTTTTPYPSSPPSPGADPRAAHVRQQPPTTERPVQDTEKEPSRPHTDVRPSTQADAVAAVLAGGTPPITPAAQSVNRPGSPVPSVTSSSVPAVAVPASRPRSASESAPDQPYGPGRPDVVAPPSAVATSSRAAADASHDSPSGTSGPRDSRPDAAPDDIAAAPDPAVHSVVTTSASTPQAGVTGGPASVSGADATPEPRPVAASLPPPLSRVSFTDGSLDIDPHQLRDIKALARQVAEVGVRDQRAGLPHTPRITITGYGNGSWLKLGTGDWTAERRGRRRADTVATVFRDELWIALDELQRNEPYGTPRVDSHHFSIVVRSRGRALDANDLSGGTDARVLRRRATIEIDLSLRSSAVERLNALRLADPDPGVRAGLFAPAPLARRILGLDAAQQVTDAHRRELYALVDEAVAAGRATSLAALEAHRLKQQGVLSDATRITARDGRALGRSLTRTPVVNLDTAWDGSGQALWQKNAGDPRPYFVVAQGDHESVEVFGPNGAVRRVPVDTFAELLAVDPDLAGLGADVPVVLVIPGAGARELVLPRTVAARTGRTVWSHAGAAKLRFNGPMLSHRISTLGLPGELTGSWIASGPGDLGPVDPDPAAPEIRTISGDRIPDSQIMSHTLAADGLPHGRAVFTKGDLLTREKWFGALPKMTWNVPMDPVTQDPHGVPEEVPWIGRKAYYFYLHGLPGRFEVVREGGTQKPAGGGQVVREIREKALGDQVGGYLRRRPSMRQLAPDGVVVLMSCWADAPAEGLPAVNAAGPAPFVSDPLETVSEAQRVSNQVGRTVFAVDRTHYTLRTGTLRRQGVDSTADGRPSRWRELRPEPAGTALDDLARTAGLHTGTGPASDGNRRTTLRLVRALRTTFGASVEDDKDDPAGGYQRLLGGIGALESMRLGDQNLRGTGEFTLDLLDRATRAHLKQQQVVGTRPAPPAEADVKATLEAASAKLAAEPGAALPAFVALPSVDRARDLLAQGDPDQRAREVLGLGRTDPVTPVHRQRLLWATVKAVEGVENHPDADALTTKVLHLRDGEDPKEAARQTELLWTAAAAAAVGRDTHHRTALAAYHLERHGALDRATELGGAGKTVTGRNWTGKPITDPLLTNKYFVSEDGTVAKGTFFAVPWRTTATSEDAYFLVTKEDPLAGGDIMMPWPTGPDRPVPPDEIAELLVHDRSLARHEATWPVVLVGSGGPTSPSASADGLAKALADRSATARNVLRTPGPLNLVYDAGKKQNVFVLTGDPANSSLTKDWLRTEPRKLPTPVAQVPPTAPVAPVAPVNPVTPVTPVVPVTTTASDPALPTPMSTTPAPVVVTSSADVSPPTDPGPPAPSTTVGQGLDERRPPRIDPDPRPAPVSGLGSLLRNLPRKVLRRPGDRVLRGVDQVVRELDSRLQQQAGVRPATPELLNDVQRRLGQQPSGVLGDGGQTFAYTTADGTPLTLTVTARPDTFTVVGHANFTKTDGLARDGRSHGGTAVNSTAQTVAPAIPPGPVKQPARTWKRLRARFSGILNTASGARPRPDHVWYEFTVTDPTGRPVDGTGNVLPEGDTSRLPVAFGFGVRDGLLVRLPDSPVQEAPEQEVPAPQAPVEAPVPEPFVLEEPVPELSDHQQPNPETALFEQPPAETPVPEPETDRSPDATDVADAETVPEHTPELPATTDQLPVPSTAAVPGPRRVLAPAPERLAAYAGALTAEDEETPGSREAMWAKRSPVLAAEGSDVPSRFVEIEDVTVGYTPAEENPEANAPVAGGKFIDVFGLGDDGSTLAVMAEIYRAPGEEFTAADAFIHQWATAHGLLSGEKLSAKALSKAMARSLDQQLSVADVPDRLPDRIYQQNISGSEAKKALGEILGDNTSTRQFTEGDETYRKILGTVNGKANNNIVKTFNDLKGYAGDDVQVITGGSLFRDANGNYQLRFDIARAADASPGDTEAVPTASTTAPDPMDSAPGAAMPALSTASDDDVGSIVSLGPDDPGPHRSPAVQPPSPRSRVPFGKRHKEIGPRERQEIADLAEQIVVAGLRDLKAGLRAPRVTVTGYGNGTRFSIRGRTGRRSARATGQLRAEAVADLLREEIRGQLLNKDNMVNLVHALRGREATVEDFPLTVVSGGREAEGATRRADRRLAVIGVDQSPLSAAVARLEQLSPGDFGPGTGFDPDAMILTVLRRPYQGGPDSRSSSPAPSSGAVSRVSSGAVSGASSPVDPGSRAPSIAGSDASDASDGSVPVPVSFDVEDMSADQRALYELVAEAMAAGRATSTAALAAFHLSKELLSDATRITAPDGTPAGRNWTGQPVSSLDTSSYAEVPRPAPNAPTTQPAPLPGPWAKTPGAPAPYTYATAEGGHLWLGAALPDGRHWNLSADIIAELMDMDRDLASRGRDTHVLLVSPKAGDMELELPRRVSARVGRTLWAHTGSVTLGLEQGTGLHSVVVIDRRAVNLPLGQWIRTEPEDLGPTDDGFEGPGMIEALDGSGLRDDQVKSVTLTIDSRPVGRSAMDDVDQLHRKHTFETLGTFTEWTSGDPVTGEPSGPRRPVPWKGRKAYFFQAHGLPRRNAMPRLNRPNPVHVHSRATGGYLARRRSLRRLPKDTVIVLLSCWANTAIGDFGNAWLGPSADSPFVADPLSNPSGAQDIANETRRTVFAPNRVHIHYLVGGLHGIVSSPSGAPTIWDEVRPEPTSAELDALAEQAGLGWIASDFSPEEARATTLRLVRALRQTFGVSVEDDKDDPAGEYQQLLGGIGALEAMRRKDGNLRHHGEFTLDLLDRVTRAHLKQQHVAGTRAAPLAEADVRATLEAAAAKLAAEPRSALPAFVALPSVDRARELIARSDPKLPARREAARATDLDPQSLLWATVKAVESVDNHPDADALTTKVLHLRDGDDPTEDVRRAELFWTTVAAAGVGRDTYNPTALAAYDVELHAMGPHGALGSDSKILTTNGRPAGRNWRRQPVQGRLGTETYAVESAGSRRTLHRLPWRSLRAGAERAEGYFLAMDPDSGSSGIDMPWQDGGTRPVPHEEIAELLSHDTELQYSQTREMHIVPVGIDRGADRLAAAIADRRATGRTVPVAQHSFKIDDYPSASHAELVMTVPPGSGRADDWDSVSPAGVSPQATPSSRTPSPQPGPAPVTPVATSSPGVSSAPTSAPPAPTDAARRGDTNPPTPTVRARRAVLPVPPHRRGGTPLTPVPEDAPTPVAPVTPDPVGSPTPRPAWIGEDLGDRRPPRLDRDLPPARVLGGEVRFSDRTRLPVYMGRVGSVLKGLSAQVLGRSFAFGHSDRALRGTDLVVDELGSRLDGLAGVRPAAAKGGTSRESALLADVRRRLVQSPQGFFGDGQEFVYTTANGRTRVLRATARPYAQWERFAFGYANPVKADSMQRTNVLTGRTAVNTTATALAPTVPLGPVKVAFNGWGRVFARGFWNKRVQYGMQNQTMSQTETRSTDGSHAHLDDVWYEFTFADRAGRPVDASGRAIPEGETWRQPVGFGFAIRDGLVVRLPDSVTTEQPAKNRDGLPAEMRLSRRSNYRSVNTEAYGPVAHIRDWVIRQAGVGQDSVAGSQLGDFFSTDSFHRMGRVLNAGQVTTPPLLRDKAKTPLGVFSVRVESGQAVLIDGTTAAELRDIMQSTVRNERITGKGAGIDIGGSAGPAFHLLGLDKGAFDLRILAGLNVRYGSSRARTSTTGGTGAIKSASQAKGSSTGLYLVQKTVTVTAPPDTKAPLPDPAGDGQGPRLIRKNPPRKWSAPPRTETFQTWAVERLTRAEARRLAGLDTDAPRGPEPTPPPYLTEDRPPTLGMSHVEEFTFADGSVTRTIDGQERTFLEHFGDRMLEAVAEVYPDLVAPLAELNPDNPRWRGADHFQMVQNNTLEVLSTLAHHSMAGNLETMLTTGLRIGLVDSRRATRAHRYVWLDADLTGRRYETTEKDERLRFSAPGSENLSGTYSGTRGLHGGVEALVAVRDSVGDNAGVPMHAGSASLGGRWGRRRESESGYGPSATHEAMSIGAKGSHLYSYRIDLTAKRGGFWRFRSLLRGVLFLNLLGTQPFVFDETETQLIGPETGPGSGPRTAGQSMPAGRVLLSIPVEHTPTRTPAKARNPLHGVPLATTRRVASDLALATDDLLHRARRRGPADYQKHPHLTLTVVADPSLARAAEEVLEESSLGSWMMSQEGAPAHDSALRLFQSPYLTANFDQSSTPTGWRASGLWAKAPYLDRSSVLAHRTRLRPGTLTALTGAVPVETETTIGGVTQAAGRDTRTSSLFFGGQLVYLHSHAAGPGVTGNYGLVASPYRLDRSRVALVSRSAVAEINRKDMGRQVLVNGDVDHEIAVASSVIGERATGWRRIPRRLAGVAGRRVLVGDGWVGHVPEKSAYRLGLLTDRWGDVPLYTARSWSPQPWLLDNPFGSWPVNSLNTSAVLADFDRKVHSLGLSKRDQDTINRLVSERVVRAIGKEMVGAGSSVPARIGRWGSESVNLWVGRRRVRARAELIPERVPRGTDAGAGTGFGGLGHSVELEEHRQAAETVQEGHSRRSGASVGTVVSEGVHTSNDTVRAAGPTYAEVGSTQQVAAQNRSEGSVRIGTATTTQAHGEYTTRYRLRLTLEITDGPDPDEAAARPAPRGGRLGRWWQQWTGRKKRMITSEGEAGELIEHYPLSLMRPDPIGTATGPDPLAPPELDAPGEPRTVPVPRSMGAGGWHDVPHPGDGTTKPFQLPEDGFKVRRVVGLGNLQAANNLAVAAAYDTSFPRTGGLDGDLLAWAKDTSLTRPGTGPAQNLEDSSSNGALTAFYDRTLAAGGYEVPGLTDRGFYGGSDADLRMYSKPDFGRAQLLTVADGVKHEAPKRDVQGGGMSVARVGATESALGGGPVTSSQDTGASQMGATGPGDYSVESDALAVSGDRLASVNVKPNPTRSFLFAIPTTWLSVAAVHHHVKDSLPGRAARTVFGNPGRGPQALETETTVLAWVREDVALRLGLIDATGFPPKVAKAWDAVTAADKGWTAADKKYWDLRRGGETERQAELAAAEGTLREIRQTLAGLTAADLDALPTELTAAQAALADLDREAGADAEPAHDGWAELARRQRQAAAGRLTVVSRRSAALSALPAAQASMDTAQTRLNGLGGELAALRKTAEDLAEEYARVREATDRLTRWHQLAATEKGRRQLGDTPEPDEVTFTPPKTDGGKPAIQKTATSQKPAEQKGEEQKPAEQKNAGSGTSGGELTASADERPAYARPPWQSPPGAGPGPGERRFDAATDHRTLTATDPDGRSRVYDLRQPSGDGNGFYAAVLAAGGGTRDPAALAGLVARSSLMPADAPLDPQAVFHTRELDFRLGPGFRSDARLHDNIVASGGRLPDSALARLTPHQRASLVRLHVQRARRWDDTTAELAASLTARTLGVDLTVVDEDGSYRHFSGVGPDTTGPLDQVIVYRRGDTYLAARPRPVTPLPTPGSDAAPAGRRVDAGNRSFTVSPVADDGNRLFNAVLGSVAAQRPGSPAASMDVRRLREHTAAWYGRSDAAATSRARHADRDHLEPLVQDLFPDLSTLLDLLDRTDTPPKLTAVQSGRINEELSDARRRTELLALSTEDEDRGLLAGLPTGVVRALLPGVRYRPGPDPTVRHRRQRLAEEAQAETLRAEVVAALSAPRGDTKADELWQRIRATLPSGVRDGVPRDRAALFTTGHGGLVDHAIRSVPTEHMSFHDEVPPLVAGSLGVLLVLVEPDGTGGFTTRHLAPDATGPAVYVHHDGHGRYETLVPAGPAPAGDTDRRPHRGSAEPETAADGEGGVPAPDQETRDWFADLAGRHGASGADVRRLTAGLSAGTLARLRAVSGADAPLTEPDPEDGHHQVLPPEPPAAAGDAPADPPPPPPLSSPPMTVRGYGRAADPTLSLVHDDAYYQVPLSKSPAPADEAPQAPAPTRPGREVRVNGLSFTVGSVRGDGNCLPQAVLDSLAGQHPDAPGPHTSVEQVRVHAANWYLNSDDGAAVRAQHDTLDPVDMLVDDLFPDVKSLLTLLGRTRGPDLTAEQRSRIEDRLTRPPYRAELMKSAAGEDDRRLLADFPVAAAEELLPDLRPVTGGVDRGEETRLAERARTETLRREVVDRLHAPDGDRDAEALWRRVLAALPPDVRAHGFVRDRGVFTRARLSDLVALSLDVGTALGGDSLRRRPYLAGLAGQDLRSASTWQTPFYDEVPMVFARSLGLDLVLVQPAGDGTFATYRFDPEAAGRTVHVLYNGHSHYEALRPTAPPAPSTSSGTTPGTVSTGRRAPSRTKSPESGVPVPDQAARDRLDELVRRHGASEEYARRLTDGLSAEAVRRLGQRSGGLGVGDDAGFDRQALEVGGDRFAGALVAALDQSVPDLLRRQPGLAASPGSLLDWLDARLATDGSPDTERVGGTQLLSVPDELVTRSELRRIGAQLTAGQQVELVLGGRIGAETIALTRLQRFRLLLARPGFGGAAFVEALAATVASELGVRLALLDAAGRRIEFGRAGETVVTLDVGRLVAFPKPDVGLSGSSGQ
ncbi:lonely Cys domain-containing protein [Streptomyces sp. STR69]|uniref:lonely Cys domain-containing protein n=1 Tax=Streptomyces sp. STR69 TaxID=1796942 RepID=UPI0021C856CA|nr:lonely Cys domain-containing protein [Streptomyces sp. STR69]